MRTFSMDMSSYQVERSEAIVSDYSDEILYAGCIPSLACHQDSRTEAMPAALAGIDVDAFLRKMYAFQR